MKNVFYLFILSMLILFSCNKDEAEPVQYPSQTDLICKTWIFEEIIHTTYVDGVVESIEDVELSDSDYEVEFNTDGTLVVKNDGYTLPGTWKFYTDIDLHIVFDSDPNTVHASVISKLTEDQFWSTATNTLYHEDVTTVIVTEVKHILK